MNLDEDIFAKPGLSQNLAEEYSPTIPKGFKPILKEICESQYINLLKCSSVYGFFGNSECEQEFENFIRCKKVRDIQIYDQIRVWETSKFTILNNEQKQKYLTQLLTEKAQLSSTFKMIPSASAYSNKRWRFSSDIEQLSWRIKYLEKMIMK